MWGYPICDMGSAAQGHGQLNDRLLANLHNTFPAARGIPEGRAVTELPCSTDETRPRGLANRSHVPCEVPDGILLLTDSLKRFLANGGLSDFRAR